MKSGKNKAGQSTRCDLTKYKSTSNPSYSPALDLVETLAPFLDRLRRQPDLGSPPAPPAVDVQEFKAAKNTLIGWILAGHSEFDLCEALDAHYPKLSAADLLAAAAVHFQDAGETDGGALRGFCIEAYRELYRKALDIGDYTTSLKALAHLEKSAGG